MVVIVPSPARLDTGLLSLFWAKDILIGNQPVLVFHGPSTTANSTLNSSRIQAHVFTIGGFISFPRLTVAPTSPLYVAVNHLPEEEQGDEVLRGLAIALLKYFGELTDSVKKYMSSYASSAPQSSNAATLFDEVHAARIASAMVRIENALEIESHISRALCEKSLSYVDLDIFLPPNSFASRGPEDKQRELLLIDDECGLQLGKFTELVKALGAPTFLPTSKLRRAPSKPNAANTDLKITEIQQRNLEREISELLKTEQNYVRRLQELTCCELFEADLWPDSGEGLEKSLSVSDLPTVLRSILEISSEFLAQLCEGIAAGSQNSQFECEGKVSVANLQDVAQIDSFVELLLKQLAHFKKPYQQYLLIHSQAPNLVQQIIQNNPLRKTSLQAVGEQRVKSWLIEPVQRLPRYVLFIENIVQQLPASHITTTKLLKAKDLIADICALDDESLSNPLVVKRLGKFVAHWPQDIDLRGRLITIAEASDLRITFGQRGIPKEGAPCFLLLFASHILVLRKLVGSSLSVRGLTAELNRPFSTLPVPFSEAEDTGIPFLSFSLSFELNSTRLIESAAGHVISFFQTMQDSPNGYSHMSLQDTAQNGSYYLLGAYEGKTSVLCEEVARARIEHRFPEDIRDSGKWSLRSLRSQGDVLGFVASICEVTHEHLGRRYQSPNSRIQLIVQDRTIFDSPSSLDLPEDIDLVARATSYDDQKYFLEFRGHNNLGSTDQVSIDDFAAVFNKRLSNFLRMLYRPVTPEMAKYHIALNAAIIHSIRTQLTDDEISSRTRFLPMSPVKALSSLLGGSNRENDMSSRPRGLNRLGVIPPEPLPQPEFVRTDTRENLERSAREGSQGNKITVVVSSNDGQGGSLSELEETLNTYILALHSRCGNVVGKVLQNRATANELEVKELYNTLVENPNQYQAAAEVSVDVLFVAFDTFLNRCWKERIGAILSDQLLGSAQETMRGFPRSISIQRIRTAVSEMAPQNRRALSAIVRLLSELLDACGNDADRGLLTAVLAEILVNRNDFHSFIPLIDMFVQEIDLIFEPARSVSGITGPHENLQRTQSTNNGSLSSTASSLRKRFGFGGLTRENSKIDSESKVGQLWRTLSKKGSGDTDLQTATLPRSFLARSKSTDQDISRSWSSRPGSRDRPPSTVPNDGESRSRPGSAHNTLSSLGAIGEDPLQVRQNVLKKKRRSSLSDLPAFKDQLSTGSVSKRLPAPIELSDSLGQTRNVPSRSPQTPSPRKTSNPGPSRPLSKLPSPVNRKENIPPADSPPRLIGDLDKRRGKSPEVLLSTKKDLSNSKIPTLRTGLQERENIGQASLTSPHKTTISSSPQKLRIQSPQKIRERLDKEKKAILQAGPGLQEELSRIGRDLALHKRAGYGSTTSISKLSSQMEGMEVKLGTFFEESKKRTDAINQDMQTSLAISQRKNKNLDELYREANAENELLYERFNNELARVLKSVKGGEGITETRLKLQEAQSEASRLRKENQRLKRENVGLRSQARSMQVLEE